MITITGASDDLIEIDGDIYEEFPLMDDEKGDLLAFSDGTVLRIAFSGPWRITPVVRGTAELTIVQAPENDEDDYTDKATLSGPEIGWVVHGIGHALKRST